MAHRIREAMDGANDNGGPLGGPDKVVEADEAPIPRSLATYQERDLALWTRPFEAGRSFCFCIRSRGFFPCGCGGVFKKSLMPRSILRAISSSASLLSRQSWLGQKGREVAKKVRNLSVIASNDVDAG